jgi:hypothetical protein
VHPKVLCSQYARAINELKEKVASLSDSVKYVSFIVYFSFHSGTNEINRQLSDELKAIKAERAELIERLEPYEKPKMEPLFKSAAPKMPDVPQTSVSNLFDFEPGTKVLAKFSETEYFLTTIRGESGDSFIVDNDGEEEKIRKTKIFPLVEDLLEQYTNAVEAELALRERVAEADAKYDKHITALEEEMRSTKADYDELKELYAVDIRKMFYSRPDAKATTQQYEAECNVACHIIDILDVFIYLFYPSHSK